MNEWVVDVLISIFRECLFILTLLFSGLSQSAFNKLIPEWYQFSPSKTDRCAGCYYGAKVLDELLHKATEKQPALAARTSTFSPVTSTSLPSTTSPLSKMMEKAKLQWNALELEKVLTPEEEDWLISFCEHKFIGKCRRDDWDLDIQNLEEGHCMIVGDFKANLQLGKGRVETDQEFFANGAHQEASIISFVVAFRTSKFLLPSFQNFVSFSLSPLSLFLGLTHS